MRRPFHSDKAQSRSANRSRRFRRVDKGDDVFERCENPGDATWHSGLTAGSVRDVFHQPARAAQREVFGEPRFDQTADVRTGDHGPLPSGFHWLQVGTHGPTQFGSAMIDARLAASRNSRPAHRRGRVDQPLRAQSLQTGGGARPCRRLARSPASARPGRGTKHLEEILRVVALFAPVGELVHGTVDLAQGGLVTGRCLVLVAAGFRSPQPSRSAVDRQAIGRGRIAPRRGPAGSPESQPVPLEEPITDE